MDEVAKKLDVELKEKYPGVICVGVRHNSTLQVYVDKSLWKKTMIVPSTYKGYPVTLVKTSVAKPL